MICVDVLLRKEYCIPNFHHQSSKHHYKYFERYTTVKSFLCLGKKLLLVL